ncbi:MAG: phosphotransferase [Verrucomicrobia bacterium]|nr:phosphotransferase [Verrucomicrobiota bacterium]
MEEFCGSGSRVVRIGRTVRRPAHRNTLAVQALLKHLEDIGFDGAPRALGIDEQGREIVSYIDGTAGHYPLKPYVLSESSLVQVARLLRCYHDASASFSMSENSYWGYPVPGEREVICHGDAGPYNIIFRNGRPVALIDFERAAPGPRIWDIGFVVYRFAPLCDVAEATLSPDFVRSIAQRIRTLLTAYGVSTCNDLFDWIQLRLQTEIKLFECAENNYLTDRQKKIEAGHLALYKRDLRLIEEVSGDLGALI